MAKENAGSVHHHEWFGRTFNQVGGTSHELVVFELPVCSRTYLSWNDSSVGPVAQLLNIGLGALRGVDRLNDFEQP